MTRPRTEPGIAAAVLGVAVAVSLGATVEAAPAAGGHRTRVMHQSGAGLDRQAVQQWLTALADAAKTWHDGSAAPRLVADPAPGMRAEHACDLTPATWARAQARDRHVTPAVPVRPNLLDLPPPAL